ncbi:hypothetical protein G4B88_006913 [Cannabis sativa]|uniref:Ammonium transporter AmtB-like domain-containing protein n=1 Tax=Cannabis sativa TaxID=3483 RepID=A0A7J6G3Q2_CANSA|nr:hypothetical protein G4B88_006913 [Cannabis sativa]
MSNNYSDIIINDNNNITLVLLPKGLWATESSPEWLNKGDNSWQLTATTMVGMQSVPGLVILYGSMVKRKWAVNSAFMALYGFATVLICWVLWGHHMSFGSKWTPFVGKPGLALSEKFLLGQFSKFGFVPMADFVYYEFVFAAITVILVAGSLLGRMNFYAWMMFVPLWVSLSYSVGAFSVWCEDGFLHDVIIDYAGGYVIHLSSGVAGFLWLGWAGFNGGSPFAANMIASIAILNTHICTATSLLVWVSMDMIVYKKSSVIGAVQGMITGLVCITPGAGIVDPWAAGIMGILSGSIPWYTMMVLHKKSVIFQSVDDTLGVFHTHAVAGLLGGLLSGVFAQTNLLEMMYGSSVRFAVSNGKPGGWFKQLGYQLEGAVFITVWNVVITSLICLLISRVVNLRMSEEDLEIGDDAVHGEEVYALWGDGERAPSSHRRWQMRPRIPSIIRLRRN